MSPVSQKKARLVWAGTENAYKLAKKFKVKTAWGADVLFDAGAASRQGAYLANVMMPPKSHILGTPNRQG